MALPKKKTVKHYKKKTVKKEEQWKKNNKQHNSENQKVLNAEINVRPITQKPKEEQHTKKKQKEGRSTDSTENSNSPIYANSCHSFLRGSNVSTLKLLK